jgi:hypothetical protein
LNPFAGPIKDDSGKEMVVSGATMPEATFSSLNWYVEGIDVVFPNESHLSPVLEVRIPCRRFDDETPAHCAASLRAACLDNGFSTS